MKHAITRRVTCVIMGLVTASILLCWLLNSTLLENYYVHTKQDTLQEVLTLMNQLSAEDSLYTDESKVELEKLCAKENITMMVMNSASRVLLVIGGDEQRYVEQLLEILLVSQSDHTQVLETGDGYTIGKYEDTRLGSNYLILWGDTEDGNHFLMRTALESIQESVNISNRFMAYIGIVVICISVLTSYFLVRRITRPILELADLSQRMTNLDFEAKYTSRGRDELDFLGEHMNELSETLEKTISELKSANNELLIDIERKNEIDDMRKEFISNVSHELKTPLAVISGYAEGLKEGILEDAESRDLYCDVIMDEANKMNRMVKQLLTLNQLEFGAEVITMERFDLTELIRGVIHSTAILREQENISLEFIDEDGADLLQEKEPVWVWADEFKTEEVMVNFMSNAIHYAAGQRHIRVSLEHREGCVRIKVFNTGSFIPEKDLEQIWVKFFKVDKARTREYGGSGIGLSIVKAIMDSFHQECGVYNLEDGVEFWFELDATGVKNEIAERNSEIE